MILKRKKAPPAEPESPLKPATSRTPISEIHWRERSRIEGTVHAIRIQPRSGIPTLECTVEDETGRLSVIFLGRRKLAGLKPGAHVAFEGTVSDSHGTLAMVNPMYELRSH